MRRPTWFAHAAWLVGITLIVLLTIPFARGLPLWVQFWFDNPPLAFALASFGLPQFPIALLIVALGVTAVAVHAATAAIILRARRDLFAVLISVALFVYGCVFAGVLNVLRANEPSWEQSVAAIATLNRAGVILVLLTFPNGQFVPAWTRWLFVLMAAWYGIAIPFREVGPFHSSELAVAESLLTATIGVAAQVYRYHRVATALERQQLKWCTYGIVFTLISWVLLGPALVLAGPAPNELYHLPPSATLTDTAYLVLTIAAALYYLANIVPPIAIAMAMLRRGLFDIDLVANRTLTYGLASALVGAGAVIVGLAAQQIVALATGRNGDAASLALGVVAVAVFGPARRRLQTLVDRVLPDRPTLTLLFTDLVGSTDLALKLGDQRWGDALQRYHRLIRSELSRHGGQEIDTAGDGVFAIFGRSDAALRCARALAEDVRATGMQARVGVHRGPCEMRAGKVIGTSVHVAARLVGLAQPDQIVLSEATRSSIAERAFQLRDEGERELKGLPGMWRVYSLTP